VQLLGASPFGTHRQKNTAMGTICFASGAVPVTNSRSLRFNSLTLQPFNGSTSRSELPA
jgi:hypothetical protein